jgi:outer membrane receptor protein involved in Fe transport
MRIEAKRFPALLGFTTFVGALAAPTAVWAAEERVTEEVVVTGSRIERSVTDEAIPVVALTAESFTNQGFTNIADLATSLPQFAPAFGESRTQSTFSGVATSGLNRANLRNAGTVRTVTLINGRRVPGGSATSPAVDFNTFPTANIERIEIMTGGASAIYGADAMAGVVNIITKKDFDGFDVELSYGESYDEGDNENPNASILWGNTFDNGGHSLITFQYTEQGQVSCEDRELCKYDFSWFAPKTPVRGPATFSGVGIGGRFFLPSGASVTTRNGSMTDANGNLIPFATTIDGYNRNADRDIAIPTDRTMAAAEVYYPIADNVRIFGEINYGEAEIDSRFEGHPFQSQAAGSLVGGRPGAPGLQATIPIDNPFMPATFRNTVLAQNPAATSITWWQRFNIFETRGADSRRDTTRLAAGFQGELDDLFTFGSDWNWEASYVWGKTQEDLNTEGLVGTDRLYDSLRVEADPLNPGQFRCADAGARAIGCVPVNVFNGPSGYTQAMKDFLQVDAATRGESELKNAVAWMSGSVYELPAGDINVAFGAEWRTFSGFRDYSYLINNALATGNQISDIDDAEIETTEAYVETVVPILSEAPFAYSLEVEGALRYSDTEDLGSDNTYKLGASWAPIEGLRFRVMQATAVRAPTPGELSGIGQTFGVIQDPCTAARRNNNPTRAANCTADGVPANYAPGQIIEQSVAGLTGGNPDLEQEEGETLTYGIVWTPTFLEGFSLTVDRFELEITDAISSVARQAATNLCYDTTNRLYCEVLTRGTSPLLPGATYVLTAVNEQLQNINEYDIRGVDVALDYVFGLESFGDFNANLLYTMYDKAEQVQPTGDTLNLLNKAGGSTVDQGFIKHTAVLNLGWRLDAINANWNMRYIGPAEMGFGTSGAGFPQLDSKLYHNAHAGYDFGERSQVYVGVNNVFGEEPPYMASGASGTQALDTVPGYYDVFGRTWYAGVKIGL